MASKTFVVEITVGNHVSEELFGHAIQRGIKEGDLHYLSYLNNVTESVNVRPYEEPHREWAVLVERAGDGQFEYGYFGLQADAEEAARNAHPGCAIVGSYIKE